MKQVSRHIISSLNWNTSFDHKESASELQSRLSTWSNVRLQRELFDIFEKVCPHDQTWKIGTLELDLGVIEFDQLEPELSSRVKEKLNEKLTELISRQVGSGSTELEIVKEITSRLSTLEHYLTSGVMPLNSSFAQASADSIMADQLLHNKTEATEMLWLVGSTHLNVRKRIAWQFSSDTMGAIVQALEPGHHEQIIDFKDNVVKLQKKESIVKSSVKDLHNNIWLWVLNYLFDERGTVFNKVDFMKSTIRQMAAHHNVQYEDLMLLIESAASNIQKRIGRSSTFVAALNILSAENKAVRNKESAGTETLTDNWHTLELLLCDPSLRRSASRNGELNDLIIGLSRIDSKRIAKLMRENGKEEKIRSSAVTDLSERSLEQLFSAMIPTAGENLLKSIKFLQLLGNHTNILNGSKAVWQTAIKFAVENKNPTITTESFLAYCIAEISNQIGQSSRSVLGRLINSEIPDSVKTTSSLEPYSVLCAAAAHENQQQGYSEYSRELIALIEQLRSPNRVQEPERESTTSLHSLLLKKIKQHPHIALDVLVRYSPKSRLHELLQLIMRSGIAGTLLMHITPVLRDAIKRLEGATNAVSKSEGINPTISLLNRYLHEWTLEGILLHNVVDQNSFFKHILTELFLSSGNKDAKEFRRLCNYHEAWPESVSIPESNPTPNAGSNESRLSLTNQLQQILESKLSTPRKTARIMLSQFSDPAFLNWRRRDTQEGITLLNLLLPTGEGWMKRIIAEYYAALAATTARLSEYELTNHLKELFWKCLLDYDSHQSDRIKLHKSFTTAVKYKFPNTINEIQQNKLTATIGIDHPVTSQEHTLNDGRTLTTRELFVLISDCFQNGAVFCMKDGFKYEMKELLILGMEIQPSEIRRIIGRLKPNDSRLKVLKSAGTFHEFSHWISSDLRGELNSGMEAMRLLHEMISLITPVGVEEDFLDEFWIQIWNIVATGSWSREDLKKLIRNSFTKMAAEIDVSAATLIMEMKNKDVAVTPMLRDELIKCFPAFSALPENKIKTEAGRKLAEFESRSLLDNLTEQLISKNKMPAWYGDSEEIDATGLLNEIITHYPVVFYKAMKQITLSEQQLARLNTTSLFSNLVQSISRLNRDKKSTLLILAEFHAAIGTIKINGITPVRIQGVLFKKLLYAWINNNWRSISIENLWNELAWDITMTYGIPARQFLNAMNKSRILFPPAVKFALQRILDQEIEKKQVRSVPTPPQIKDIIKKVNPNKKSPLQGIPIRNAGIVLLNDYIQMLFERLGTTDGRKFASTNAQVDSIHYLQFVVTGITRTEEHLLPLNKVLCGLPFHHPVHSEIEITEDQKSLIHGLIKAAISHWPTIGDTSIEGFRGNWLVRDGILTEQEDKWELIVEKRAYDILINKSPYSFSIIKYPWMSKPLHVIWPY